MGRRVDMVKCTGCGVKVQSYTATVRAWTPHGYRAKVRLCRPCTAQLYNWLGEYSRLVQGLPA